MMGPRMTKEQALDALASMTEADFPTTDQAMDLTDDDIEQMAVNGRRAWGRPSLTAPGEHSPMVNFRVPAETKSRLAYVAARQGRRPSDVGREALERYLDEQLEDYPLAA